MCCHSLRVWDQVGSDDKTLLISYVTLLRRSFSVQLSTVIRGHIISGRGLPFPCDGSVWISGARHQDRNPHYSTTLVHNSVVLSPPAAVDQGQDSSVMITTDTRPCCDSPSTSQPLTLSSGEGLLLYNYPHHLGEVV